ncbi:TonB-dependent receptor, partial [Aequorivita sp. SDUM287046]
FFFGIHGASDIKFLGKDISADDLFSAEDENSIAESGFLVSGLKHRLTLGEKSFLKTVIAGSFSNDAFKLDRIIDLDSPQERTIRYTETDNSETRFTFSTLFNTKLSNRTMLRAGVMAENFNIKNLLLHRHEQPDANNDGDPDLNTFRNIDANLIIVQPYVQGQFRLTEDLTLDTGLHLQYSSLNNQLAVEPRASIDYEIGNVHRLSAGYGMHHQNIPYPLLFLNEEVNGQTKQTNKELDFVRSQHYVLGYDVKLGPKWRGKVELYYQNIDKAGVDSFESSYSTITEGADFGFSDDRVSLVNEGTGYNKGVEITLEKFFSKGYYVLLTGSFFDAKYTGSDEIERNSPFNNQYVANILAGKEFVLGKTNERTLFFDTRFTTSGGRYYTPIDLEASREAGYEIRQNELAYSQQYDDYLRLDFKFGMKLNRKKTSLQFYVDFQNVTNNKNIFVTRYNRLTNNVDRVNQIGFFPDFGCKLQF